MLARTPAKELMSSAQFARSINAMWRDGALAIIKTGVLLLEAKAQLARGTFTEMVEKNLPFGMKTAQRLMAIGRDKRIVNNIKLMPPSWSCLAVITELNDEQFADAVKKGKINPEMRRVDIGGTKHYQVTLSVTRSQYARLQERAKAERVSLAKCARGIIEAALKKRG